MSDVSEPSAAAADATPVAPFREAVAAKAKVTAATVDLVLDDVGAKDEHVSRRADHLAIRRLMFSGAKNASGYDDGPYTFEWKDLGPGLFAALSDGRNQVGKSTILEVMLWGLRGTPRSLKPEVRSWIDTVELEFTIGAYRYCINYTDFEAVPRGKLVLQSPGPARILKTFEGDEKFESVMGDLMMERFALQPIPNVSHGGEEANEYVHSWSAYAASMFIEGSHPAILGDVTVGALWWRMLHLFVGMPYAALHMALRNAVTLEQAQRDGAAGAKAKQDNYSAELRRAEADRKPLEERLKKLSAGALELDEIDALSARHAQLSWEGAELQAKVAQTERNVAALRQEKDEARATQRRLNDGAASKRIFAGLKPVCCPRCAESIPDSRSLNEESAGRCAVCDRATLQDDTEALNDAIIAAGERVASLASAESTARAMMETLRGQAQALEDQRSQTAQKLKAYDEQAAKLRERREVEGQLLKLAGAIEQLRALMTKSRADRPSEDRLRIIRSAESIAETRMKDASADLFRDLETEVVDVARRFGFRGLQAISIKGNKIQLTVSGVGSSYSKQTAGQRLRLRIALVIAMIRMAHRSGYGNHPGLLLIDSPGSEELSDEDLVAMIEEIRLVTNETPNLQIFLASARAGILAPTIDAKHVRLPAVGGAMF